MFRGNQLPYRSSGEIYSLYNSIYIYQRYVLWQGSKSHGAQIIPLANFNSLAKKQLQSRKKSTVEIITTFLTNFVESSCKGGMI